jgi:hypothetical protein
MRTNKKYKNEQLSYFGLRIRHNDSALMKHKQKWTEYIGTNNCKEEISKEKRVTLLVDNTVFGARSAIMYIFMPADKSVSYSS